MLIYKLKLKDQGSFSGDIFRDFALFFAKNLTKICSLGEKNIMLKGNSTMDSTKTSDSE